jgi:hypothetical protein
MLATQCWPGCCCLAAAAAAGDATPGPAGSYAVDHHCRRFSGDLSSHAAALFTYDNSKAQQLHIQMPEARTLQTIQQQSSVPKVQQPHARRITCNSTPRAQQQADVTAEALPACWQLVLLQQHRRSLQHIHMHHLPNLASAAASAGRILPMPPRHYPGHVQHSLHRM